MLSDYLAAVAVVFGVNLLPAFGPPTWSVLVVLQLSLGLNAVLLVPLGALAATAGRLILASGARRFRDRLSTERLEGLDALQAHLLDARHRGRRASGLALFLVSPLPSAQLFVGAGILRLPLLPLGVAFLAGRLVAYSIYLSAAGLAVDSLGEVSAESLRSPLGLALQVAMLAALVALIRIDWTRLIRGDYGHGPAAPTD